MSLKRRPDCNRQPQGRQGRDHRRLRHGRAAALEDEGRVLRSEILDEDNLDYKLDVGLFQKLPDISGGGEPSEDTIDALAVAKEKATRNALPTASRVNFTIMSRSIQIR